MRELLDDLGRPVSLPGAVGRVVSLVPSITESLVSVRRDGVVGATDWCTYPADLDVARVRGTKNPDVARIAELAPDLVVANQEENRELDVHRLTDAGVAVWVTRTESVPEALASLRRLLVDALAWDEPAWLDEAGRVWAEPPSLPPLRAAVAVWRDPWMAVGRGTFTGDLVERLGLVHVLREHAGRYPHVDAAALDDPASYDVVLLPDEPYAFSADDGPEAFARVPTALVDGRSLTWYGPSLVDARTRLERAVRAAAGLG
ncbi:MAG: helical backbone metal receptor [Candidatus Nanopelagicales bacterium]